MLEMPVLETSRLLIRPFSMEDLDAAYRLFDIELREYPFHKDESGSLEERKEWLQWSALNHRQLAILYQPPYGDRAVILKATGELIGSTGLVPCLAPFGQLPSFRVKVPTPNTISRSHSTPEVGLFYAISPVHRQQGYAHEAAQALVDYSFQSLDLERIVATTENGNLASIGVMKKLGMRIEKNMLPEPAWFQVVGILDNL